MQPVSNFTVIESVYGKFIVNRYCHFQAEVLIKTGRPHIQGELNIILGIVNTLPPECVVVDAGANIGLVTIPIAQAIRERGGRVYAFEVQRMMYYALCGSLALNDLENVHAFQKGLGLSHVTVKMAVPDYGKSQDFGQYSLVYKRDEHIHLKQNPIQEDVEIITIDELNLPRLDFLKIDVEGMEISVLGGAKRMIEAHRPWCWVEYWHLKMEEIKAQFNNYRFFVINERDLLCAPKEKLDAMQIKISAQEV